MCSSVSEGHIAFHPEDASSTYRPTNPHDVTYQEKVIFIHREYLGSLNVLFVTTPRRNLLPNMPLSQWVPSTARPKRESDTLFPDKGVIKILCPYTDTYSLGTTLQAQFLLYLLL
jgi:hypothetical protein